MRQARVVLAWIGALAFASAAHAAAPAFNDLDEDHDGFLTREEAASVKGLDFTKADTNRDGRLDRAEYSAAVE
jgi:EF hand